MTEDVIDEGCCFFHGNEREGRKPETILHPSPRRSGGQRERCQKARRCSKTWVDFMSRDYRSAARRMLRVIYPSFPSDPSLTLFFLLVSITKMEKRADRSRDVAFYQGCNRTGYY